jgi:hypothetical protein
MRTSFAAASELMRQQGGTLSREQALAAGLSDRQIAHLVATGRWSRPLRGVYLSADADLTWAAWAHAFVLAAGPGARLIGETAAALRELTPKTYPITVAVPADRRPRLRHAKVRVLRLDVPVDDRMSIDGLPTTKRLRTAVDVAHLVRPDLAQPILDRMLVLDHVDLDELTAAVFASRRNGSASAKRLVATANDRAAAESERRVRRLLRDAGITGWVSNYEVTLDGVRRKLDLALVDLRIGIEVKGWMFHSLTDRGASDDDKVTDLQLSDWVVIPIGWLSLNQDPDAFVKRVQRAIEFRTRQQRSA